MKFSTVRNRSALPLTFTALALALSACAGPTPPAPSAANAHPGYDDALASQAACQSLVPASQGGPMPEGDTAVLRWLGTSNFELAYHGKVILMDTFYDRPQRTRPLGFTVNQVKKADVILIGHAHFDHISDVAPVAAQTGAPVIGSAISTLEATMLGVPPNRVVTVKGGETLTIGDIVIKPTHIVHSTIQPGLIPALVNLYNVDAPPLTPQEQAQNAAVQARGSKDPKIVTEGTMGFTFHLPGGYKIVWFDSVGNPTPDEIQLAKDLSPGVDVAIFPWTPHPIAETQLGYTFQHINLFKPKLYIPDHNDSIWGAWLDNGLSPLFMKIRDEMPGTNYVAPLYKSAICLNTSGSGKGQYNVRM
jgi:L-ascorbate metabolism protein UlaG (beta-lactamase superfamily)